MSHNLRHFLIEAADAEAGEEFCARLLESGEFWRSTLNDFFSGTTSKKTKRNLALELAEEVVAGTTDIDGMMLRYCQQPRQWLAIRERVGKPKRDKLSLKTITASDFLTKPTRKDPTWCGPFVDPESGTQWYVYSRLANYFIVDDLAISAQRVRWSVVVELRNDGICAFHWNNFSTNTTEKPDVLSMYPYWNHVPGIIREFTEDMGAAWSELNLAEIVLHKMMSKYDGNPSFEWVDSKIRALHESVALNASAPIKKQSKGHQVVAGLRALTRALAGAALRVSKVDGKKASTQENLKAAERAVLQTMLIKWGTRSYGFALLDKTVDPDQTLARMHVYFGVPGAKQQDSLQHVLCYDECGRSAGALQCLLDER